MVKGITAAGEVPDENYSIQNWLHEIVNCLSGITEAIDNLTREIKGDE